MTMIIVKRKSKEKIGDVVFQCVKTNGEVIMKDYMSLSDVQAFVGGYVEKVGDFLVNEEGLRLKLRRNRVYGRFVGNVVCLIPREELNERNA